MRERFKLVEALAGCPVKTADGREVTDLYLFDTAVKELYPLHGVVDGEVHTWTAKGKHSSSALASKMNLEMSRSGRFAYKKLTVQQACQLVRKIESGCKEVYIGLWQPEDFSQQLQRKVTLEEAAEIVSVMYRRHDCNVGVNWEFIDYCAEQAGVTTGGD